MERMSYYAALSMGVAGVLCGLLLAKRRSRAAQITPSHWLFALALPLIIFLMTLPAHPPFESGQGFGRGFLLGGAGALLAGWMVLRMERRDESRSGGMASTLMITSPQSVGLLAAIAPLLWMRQNLLDTLLGVAIGWLCATFPLLLGAMRDERESGADALPLTAGLGFVVTLCALFALGEMRSPAALFHSTQRVSWNMVGATLAAGVPFFGLLSALPNTLFLKIGGRLSFANPLAQSSGGAAATEDAGKLAAQFLRGMFGLGLFLVLGSWLSGRVMPQKAVAHLVLLGFFMALAAFYVVAERGMKARSVPSAALQNHALALLLFAAGGMVSYQWLQGYGVGVWLISVWLIVSFTRTRAMERADLPGLQALGQDFLNLALFGVVLLLYRVVMSRFSDDLHGANLSDQYALFGLIVGAFSPALLSGYAGRGGSSLFRLLPVGLLTLAIPGVALLMYGAKCGVALLLGAALSFGLSRPASEPSDANVTAETPAPPPNAHLLTPIFALAFALALAQWTGRALDYTLLAKAQKLHVLEATGGTLIVLLLLADYGGRFRTWRENRNGTPTASKGTAQ